MRRDQAPAPSAADCWSVRGRVLSLARPLVMGIVNVTPDSFSDGGQHSTHGQALAHAQRLIEEGADILDIGGESTRPGAADVPLAEELDRVVPLIESLAAAGIPLSVDTSKPDVMRAALDAGAAIVNDVYALRAPGALDVVAASDCGVVLMHMQGVPRTMQVEPRYDDVVAEVAGFLRQRLAALQAAGVKGERIALDPGFGFGKTVEHNFTLLRELPRLAGLGCAVVAGMSRKSMLGAVTGRALGERVTASVVGAVLAVERGARVVRVHDVAATRDGLRVWEAMQGGQARGETR
ncbi:MAG: dihydropteroate synthase [Burkholderiaceae bacterium]|nr:dihydropteroate synthase [Burkholderiaceae bacterium]MDH5207173.1 dihydropteroate synthase [Burkholderiaceae bacterium]